MRFKRVFLINPAYGKGHYGAVLCAGLGYLSEYLKKNSISHDVWDMSIDPKIETLFEKIRGSKPDLIAMSIMSPLYAHVYEILTAIQKEFPNMKIVVGGPHVSTFRKKVFECDAVDYAIKLEGETTLLELCKGTPLKKIKGFLYRDGNKIVENPDRPFETNLDKIPFPKYEKFDLDKYPEKTIPIVTSRGCPFSCTFCPVKVAIGQQFRMRSGKNVVDELEYWYRLGYRRFGIIDDNFTLVKKHVYDICDEIEKRNLTDLLLVLGNGVRADGIDREMLKRLKKVGVNELAFGVESANEDILKKVKKGEKLGDIENAIKIALDLEMEVGLFFILGLPGETETHVRNSFRFAQKYPVAYAYFYMPTPFPQTEMYEQLNADKCLISPPSDYLNRTHQWSSDPCFSTPELSIEKRKQLYKEGERISLAIKRKFLGHKFKRFGPLGALMAYIVTRKYIHSKIMTSSFVKKILAKIYFNLGRKSSYYVKS
ncbi:MAG: radical SAM protein [archaeon]